MDRMWLLLSVLATCLMLGVEGILHFRQRTILEQEQNNVYARTTINYRTKYITVDVDHFNFGNGDTFQLRYLINDAFWDKTGSGPIFFYTGNEGDIEMFCNNTGFMWDIASEYSAMLVFAEHRYYGKSLPYGKDSYKGSKLGYLTSEQALADFATLITDLKASISGAAQSPVVAFGGSYGGMLASWLRMKYPNVVVGAIAASAPVLWFGDLTPCNSFYKTITQDFQRESSSCVNNIRSSWSVIDKMAKTEAGRKSLAKALRLCDTPKLSIKEWLVDIWGNLAMVDYPYAANFLENLPAWPIKEVCKHLSYEPNDDLDLITMVGNALNLYFNYTGDAACFNTSEQAQSGLSDQGWNFQACTEMVMPMCADGQEDMFWPMEWNLAEYTKECNAKFAMPTRPNWIQTQYWGKKLASASNIVFSNGRLDPWSNGGVQEDISDTVVAVWVENGAHHLDLRSANPADPASVVAARALEKTAITSWIEQHNFMFSYAVGYEMVDVPGVRRTGKEWSLSQIMGEFARNYIPLTLGVFFLLMSAILIIVLYNSRQKKGRHSNHNIFIDNNRTAEGDDQPNGLMLQKVS